jgi:hypothetical protein
MASADYTWQNDTVSHVVTVWGTTAIQVNIVVIHCYGPTTVMILAAVCAEVEAYCILMIVMTLARLGDLMPG